MVQTVVLVVLVVRTLQGSQHNPQMGGWVPTWRVCSNRDCHAFGGCALKADERG
jgi:hypothetical protein